MQQMTTSEAQRSIRVAECDRKGVMMFDLRSRYGKPGKPVVTAHRGFSGQYPENTLLAFAKAREQRVDIVEFDVRESSDGALVIMHDVMLNRTTDGQGPVSHWRLTDLKRLNAAYWRGPHDSGERTAIPACDESIPTLEEALEALAGQVGLNIQVYTDHEVALERIVRLYLHYDLQDSGFLMLRSFAEGMFVRDLSPDVAICIGEDRANLDRHLAFRADYIQPTRDCLTESYVRRLIDSEIPANVFFANDPCSMSGMIGQGVPGIMTDFPDILIDLIAINRGESSKTGQIKASSSGKA